MSKDQFHPCPLCGELKQVKSSKKIKPYYVCDACGVQVFVRCEEGVQILAKIKEDPELTEALNSGDFLNIAKLLRIKNRIKVTKTEINNLEARNILVFENKFEKDLLERLKSKLERFESEYLSILTGI